MDGVFEMMRFGKTIATTFRLWIKIEMVFWL